MKLKLFYIPIFLSLVVLSCTDPSPKDTSKTASQEDYKILKTDIDELTYTDYVLSSASEKATADWTKFHELETEIEVLKDGKLSFFTDDAKILRTFVVDMNTTIPESINTEDVTTRISAIENALYFLFSELNLNRKDKAPSLEAIQKLLVSVSNLKLQINKKLELDSQNILRPQ